MSYSHFSLGEWVASLNSDIPEDNCFTSCQVKIKIAPYSAYCGSFQAAPVKVVSLRSQCPQD